MYIVLYLIFIGKGVYNMLITLNKSGFIQGGRRSFDFLTLFLSFHFLYSIQNFISIIDRKDRFEL